MAVTMSRYGSCINRLLCHFDGLSTDEKPIDRYTDESSGEVFYLENGSSFREIDKDKVYLYDVENKEWNLASSGGGGGSATLIEKSITENGEYNASADGADGYSKVTVNVSGGGGETFEVNVTMSGQGVITVDKTYSEIKAAIDNNKVIVGDVNFADLWHVNIGCGCVSDIIKNGATLTTDAVILTTEVYVQTFGYPPESTQDIFVIKSDNTYEMIENGIYY